VTLLSRYYKKYGGGVNDFMIMQMTYLIFKLPTQYANYLIDIHILDWYANEVIDIHTALIGRQLI